MAKLDVLMTHTSLPSLPNSGESPAHAHKRVPSHYALHLAQVTGVPLPVNITSSAGTVTFITLSAVNSTGQPGNLTVLQVHTGLLLGSMS